MVWYGVVGGGHHSQHDESIISFKEIHDLIKRGDIIGVRGYPGERPTLRIGCVPGLRLTLAWGWGRYHSPHQAR
jgi:hypothetical protein